MSLGGARVLVTGATGFIGSSLCLRLAALDAEVHAVSRRPSTNSALRSWQLDLTDAHAAAAVIADVRPGMIFHLASQVSGSRSLDAVLPTLRQNLLTTVNLLIPAAELGCRFVHAGSMEEPVAGAAASSPYAAAKSAAAGYVRHFHALYDVPVVHLRIHMVYGPGHQDRSKLVPYVITEMLEGRSPRLGSGRRPVDWIYVDDVVEALLAAAEADSVPTIPIDIGSGDTTTVRQVVESIEQIIGGPPPLFGALPDRPLETTSVADIGPARKALGWAPKVSLDEGLRRTVAWFKQHSPLAETVTDSPI